VAHRIRELKNDWFCFRLTGTGLGRSIYVLLRMRRRCRGIKVIIRRVVVFRLRREVAIGVVPLNMLVEVLSTIQSGA